MMVEGVVFSLLYTLLFPSLLLFTCGCKKKKVAPPTDTETPIPIEKQQTPPSKAVGSPTPSGAVSLQDAPSSKNQLKSAPFTVQIAYDGKEPKTLSEMAFEKIDSDISREPLNVAIANQVRNIRTFLGKKKSENDAKGDSPLLESTAKSETVSAESHENQPITTTTTESSDRTQETPEDDAKGDAPPLYSTASAKSETKSTESDESQVGSWLSQPTTTTTESSDRTQETPEDSGESEAGSSIIHSNYNPTPRPLP